MQTNETVAALLADMREDDARARETTEDKWLRPRSLHPDAAEFLHLLARAANAKSILEIGTSVGYSTVHLALAAQETGGHVTTLELLPAKYEAAQANLARGGLLRYVTQHLGDALALLPDAPRPLGFSLPGPRERAVRGRLELVQRQRPARRPGRRRQPALPRRGSSRLRRGRPRRRPLRHPHRPDRPGPGSLVPAPLTFNHDTGGHDMDDPAASAGQPRLALLRPDLVRRSRSS